MTTQRIALFTMAASLMLADIAIAADAGSVIFARGTVTAEREPPVALAKGDAVLDNDTIVTGAASRAQLLMLDGAKIAIRPDSRLVIEEFVYTDPAATSATITTSSDKSVMNLVKEDAPTGMILSAGAGAFSMAQIVETNGAFVGQVKTAHPIRERAGERALDVTK